MAILDEFPYACRSFKRRFATRYFSYDHEKNWSLLHSPNETTASSVVTDCGLSDSQVRQKSVEMWSEEAKRNVPNETLKHEKSQWPERGGRQPTSNSSQSAALATSTKPDEHRNDTDSIEKVLYVFFGKFKTAIFGLFELPHHPIV